ncbi:MAG: GNAT family N-acetyltransferase [Methanomassiliicoccales archaeon]|nr:GNAT family N-acetyltransferase [Methanomassiliicoccales archaeon]
MLKGERVGLRPLETEDAILLFKWFNDQRVLEDLGAEHIYFCVSLEEEKAFVEKMLLDRHSRFFIVTRLEGGKPLGLIGLANMDPRNAGCELRLVLGEVEEWGKGYGEEAVRILLRHAFDSLNMHRVWLRVADYNERALRLYRRCGFRDDGALRDDHFHKGGWCSARIMSLLESEWRSA